jgi:hypothetical protein
MATASLMMLLAALWPGSSPGQALCSEPIVPICIELDTSYGEPAERKRCKQDIAEYLKDSKQYKSCLYSALESERAMRKKVPAYFRCRVEGGNNCGSLLSSTPTKQRQSQAQLENSRAWPTPGGGISELLTRQYGEGAVDR